MMIATYYRVPTMSDDFTPDFSRRTLYPEVAAAEVALQTEDWPAFRAVFDRAQGWRLRAYLMELTDGMDGSERFLRKVIERDPEDLVATTMYAGRLVILGWNIRTAKRAKDVSREQFAAFHDHLRQAEQILIWVCARDPSFVPAWLERVTISRGLGLGQSESRRRYSRLAAHDPHNVQAQASLLQELCPKWHGDFPTMHAFAAQCAAEAPPGAHNAALIIDGHLEHWTELDKAEADQYFSQESVQQEILAAAERSVLHPSFDRGVGWVYPMSTFAFAFTMMGDWTNAKRCFVELGPYADAFGWNYLGDHEKTFVKWRAAALEHG